MAAVRSGQLTPMFFGSAMSNFGVQLFLETFISLASPPGGGPVLIKYWIRFCCFQAGQCVGISIAWNFLHSMQLAWRARIYRGIRK